MKMMESLRKDPVGYGRLALLGMFVASCSLAAFAGDNNKPVALRNLGNKLTNLAPQPAPTGTRVGTIKPKLKSVLVHLQPGVKRAAMRSFARVRRAQVRFEYRVLPNVINIRGLTDRDIARLKRMPGVLSVEDDKPVHAHLARSTPLIRALQSQITGAGLSADGTGVRVCVIDTGIDSDHIMFSNRIDVAAGRDFVNNDNNPEDDNGHGTNVSGIILGGTGITTNRCGVNEPFQGVAPNATLIGVKVLDQNGSGTFSDVIAGIDYCADQTAAGGRADVINMSLGGGSFGGNCDGDSAAAASNNAVNAGVVVVASSGNECNGNAMGTPACASGVIAVGAVYDEAFPNCDNPNQNGFTWCCDSFCFSTCTDNNVTADKLTCFGNQSDTIDVAAPGCIITSADNAPGGTTTSGMCGTSQASPHVAGLAALILSADPTLTPAAVRQIIRDGAVDKGPAGFDRGYGFGRIDAVNSLQLVVPGCVTNADCDDGLFCNGAETCAGGTCQAGTAVNCNDGVACTTDTCNEATNSCDNTPNDAACDDGLACNGAETCDTALGCLTGTAVNCNDGVPCTTDACNEPGGTCSNTPNNAACDDGLFCNGAETCDAALGCLAGTAVNCNDGVACTDDSCNNTTGQCDNIANNANCDDGIFCNGAETCDAVNDCQAGSNPCPGQICDEPTQSCVACVTNADCDDGLFCNGSETCVAGACQAGTPVDCNDGVTCTTDSCNEATASCDHVASDAACDNGLFCDGTETCDPVFDCQAGTAVDCNDGIVCTTDSCNEATNACDNIADNAACDDGIFCNGAEICDTALGCLTGTPVNCNDGVACTVDSCNEATASCDHVPDNANCPDDGLFCNGTESCDPVNDCVSSGNPCPTNTVCNEATNACDTQMTGQGFILSRNPDFSTDDRTFFQNDTLYMLVWTDAVDFNNLRRNRWELKDPNKNKVRQPLTNNFDITYTASFALSGLPSNATDWTWKADVQDNARNQFKPSTTITVLAAPACTVNADCDDGDACTTDVCSGGSCSNTPVNCDDGNACTADSCDPASGLCNNVLISCDDGNSCTIDACDPVAGCSNTPINCDDGDPCTSDTCVGGVCFNDPLPTCCGDGFCDPGEDVCNCSVDCGAPPATETSCTNGIDDDCDGFTDCADADCNGDPACSGPTTGEGYILSKNADFSTDDRTFNRTDTLYMLVWTDVVDFNDIRKKQWELKDPNKKKVKQNLTNNFDITYTAQFNLSGLPSSSTTWTFKATVEDNAGNKFKPSDVITVLP